MNIGENLKEIRVKKGMSQTALSEKLCVTQATVAMWETGKATPRVDKLVEIAEVLECEISDLLQVKKA